MVDVQSGFILRQHGRVDIESSISSSLEDPWRYKKTKGDSNDQVYWQAVRQRGLDPIQR